MTLPIISILLNLSIAHGLLMLGNHLHARGSLQWAIIWTAAFRIIIVGVEIYMLTGKTLEDTGYGIYVSMAMASSWAWLLFELNRHIQIERARLG